MVAVYLPVGGTVELALDHPRRVQWFDPRLGTVLTAAPMFGRNDLRVTAPDGADGSGHPWDWVLIVSE